jgi:serine phosphatase RsbU (regulator of sigma subunit)
MSYEQGIQSVAFKRATLQSERSRIIGLLILLSASALLVLFRASISTNQAEKRVVPKAIFLVVVVIAYEGLMLKRVGRKIQESQDFPRWFWGVNFFIETLLPTGLLFLLTESPYLGPYRALVAPAVLTYFLGMILSTLRLSPQLSRLTGLYSAGGYLAVAAYTFWNYPRPNIYPSGFGLEVILTYAAMLLIGGFVAGAVAGEIRKHVLAALREAETRRLMEKMEHDLNVARSIQQGLMPAQPPPAEHFDIAGWNLSADQTGGDYFDWQTLPDGRIVVTLGDSTGHGIGPALVATACRAYSRACFLSGQEISKVLDRINDLLVADLPQERFVTFVAALVDPIRFQIQLLSAGHGPLLLYTAADQRIQNINPQGIPLGLLAGVPIDLPLQIDVAPGDILLLVTDGFFEWVNAQDEQFGVERMEEVIRAHCHRPAEELISTLYGAVLKFAAGTQQLDDLTAVVVKRKTSRGDPAGSF